MINNKFINTSRSINYNLKNNKFKKKNIRYPFIWFLTDIKKTNCPLKIIQNLPKKSGVIIRNYSRTEQLKTNAIKKYRHNRLLSILVAGKCSRRIFLDGVHYPRWLQSSNMRKSVIKTISVHSGKDIRKSVRLKADLVFVSPVFKTTSHKKQNYLGVAKLGLLVRLFKIPVIALGGINGENVSRLKSLPISGCAGIDVFL